MGSLVGKRPPRPPSVTRMGRRQRSTLNILEQMTRLQGGRGMVWTPGGPAIPQPGTDVRIALTGSGGIRARMGSTLGSATVTEYTISQTSPTDATITATPTTFVAFNYSGTPVGAGKFCVVRLTWGLWLVVSAEC
jgi:hypothetical protein